MSVLGQLGPQALCGVRRHEARAAERGGQAAPAAPAPADDSSGPPAAIASSAGQVSALTGYAVPKPRNPRVSNVSGGAGEFGAP